MKLRQYPPYTPPYYVSVLKQVYNAEPEIDVDLENRLRAQVKKAFPYKYGDYAMIGLSAIIFEQWPFGHIRCIPDAVMGSKATIRVALNDGVWT